MKASSSWNPLPLLLRLEWRPAQILALSFAGLILVGTGLLWLPVASATGKPISFLDALFTATSAVCVTGLVVLDTGKDFSLFGQWVILGLVQLGGIGIMTFTAFFVTVFRGGTMGIRDRSILQDVLDVEHMGEVARLIRSIVVMTFSIEGVGILILFPLFLWHDFPPLEALYTAVFHGISAFTNAGFSLFSDSLQGFRSDVGINLVMMILIILGGMGFPVLLNLWEWFRQGTRRRGLTLHTRIVLVTTSFLVGGGGILLYLSEWHRQFSSLPIWEGALAVLFQAAASRTAGFGTLDMGTLSAGSLIVLCVLMFIGGSPGSTAGGIKVVTVAVVFSATRALFQGRERPELFGRTLPLDILMKAYALLCLALVGLMVACFALSLVQPQPIFMVFFECVSALGTVGLSMGLTPDLSPWGKILVILMMFVGRIGPLGLILAIGQRRQKGLYFYPEERVVLG